MRVRLPAPLRFPALRLLALVVALAVLVGCTRGKRTTCSFFVKNLGDPQQVDEALRKVGELGCTAALPRLDQLFEAGNYREEVTRAVKFIVAKAVSTVDRLGRDIENEQDPALKANLEKELAEAKTELTESRTAAHQLLIKALKAPETAVIAASVVEEWKVAEAESTLAEVIRSSDLIKARTAAIKALAAAQKSPETHKELYVWVSEQDPNVQGIDAFRVAVEELGRIGTPDTLPQLLRALFIKNQRGEEVYAVARWAIARVGKPSVAAIISILSGEDAEFIAWTQKRGIPDWEWRYGPKIIQSLADLRDPSAAPAVIENLAAPLRPLENVPPDVSESWRRNQVNRIKVCMFALAAMRSDEIIERATALILNPENDIQQRLDTASALAMIGTQSARDALFEIWGKSPKQQFRQPLLIPISLGMHHGDADRFASKVLRDKAELVARGLEDPRVQGYRAAIDKCGGDRGCYLKLVADLEGPLAGREKAALLLSHLRPEPKALFAPLIKAFNEAKPVHVDLKRYLLMAIARNATKADIPALEAALSLTRESRRLAYWTEELKMLIEWVRKKA